MQSPVGLTWVSALDTPQKTYITRVINLGTLDEWKEMNRSVPKAEIIDALEHPLRGQWTKKGKAFAECIFGKVLPDDVLISYE